MVFSSSIAVGIKISVLPVGAREDRQADFGNLIVMIRAGLGSAQGTFVGAAADAELVVVLGEGLQVPGFNLQEFSTFLAIFGYVNYLDSVVDI